MGDCCATEDKGSDCCNDKQIEYPKILNCNSNDANAADAVPEQDKHCDKAPLCQSFIYIETGFLHRRTVERFENTVNQVTHSGEWVVNISVSRGPLRTTCVANFALVPKMYEV